VPGRWLERVGLIGGAEVDLDEGLRALLEAEEADRDRDRDKDADTGGDNDDDRPGPG
jgi:hypothetical protein